MLLIWVLCFVFDESFYVAALGLVLGDSGPFIFLWFLGISLVRLWAIYFPRRES